MKDAYVISIDELTEMYSEELSLSLSGNLEKSVVENFIQTKLNQEE